MINLEEIQEKDYEILMKLPILFFRRLSECVEAKDEIQFEKEYLKFCYQRKDNSFDFDYDLFRLYHNPNKIHKTILDKLYDSMWNLIKYDDIIKPKWDEEKKIWRKMKLFNFKELYTLFLDYKLTIDLQGKPIIKFNFETFRKHIDSLEINQKEN